jgi:hypothetical protein
LLIYFFGVVCFFPKDIAFMSTNCGSGGATGRTAYVKELMEHIQVDSLGKCLHNTDMPPDMQFPIYSDHGSSMKNKIQVFQDYKFVLTFENNNVTDYVSEKIINVFQVHKHSLSFVFFSCSSYLYFFFVQAGAVPIYMGSPTIDDWIPGEHSIIKTSDFKGPKHLAEYLKYLLENEEEYNKYFEWKKKPLLEKFERNFNNCVFYGAECRLCKLIHEWKSKLSDPEKQEIEKRKNSDPFYYMIGLDGQRQYLQVPDSDELRLENEFTFSAWLWIQDFDRTILSKDMYQLSVKKVWKRGYVELCVGDKCFLGTHPLVPESWYHIVAIFHFNEDNPFLSFVKFFVNGVEDQSMDIPSDHPKKSQYTSSDLYIGTTQDKISFFHGRLDDISIWKKSVPLDRAKNLVWDVLAGYEDGLVAYWSFNHLDHSQAFDVRDKYHATIQGDIAWLEGVARPLVTVNPCL